ncbi:MAG: UDP-N-acetylglucosamine 2-epimerase (hydrolyzing) [Spartobacteria bacterium]|nr:UDP-N-acetylglucosamine 2-epimerase (hydrolyzing) [Spartobacteria bacterium]
MRTIGIITAGRSDFGIYRPLAGAIQNEPGLELVLYATGGHFSKEHGYTIDEINAAGLPVTALPVPVSGDTPQAVAQAMGAITAAFSDTFAQRPPDVLVSLGDRYEMIAAALASVPFCIPLAHLHGGELSEGAMDNVFRHALTKLSHLHFASTATAARRIVHMGEEPWRVTTCGALGLDNLAALEFLDKAAIEQKLGIALDAPPVLVTYHPATLEPGQTEQHMNEFIRALARIGHPLIISYPNTDMASATVIRHLQAFAAARDDARLVYNLGTQLYFSLMRIAHAMLGNSSSGIIEAASFKLPVINVGTRQQGRLHAENVLDTPCREADILKAFETISQPAFRTWMQSIENPYGDGHTAPRILSVLRDTPINGHLLKKKFHLPEPQQEGAS